MAKRPVPSQDATIDALLAKSKRVSRRVPLREAFVQDRTAKRAGPGPLAELVRRGDERALDLYLLVLMVASSDPWDVVLPAAVWARGLGVGGQHGRASITKIWARLEQERLVQRGRAGRRARVVLQREDGSGKAYTNPDGARLADRYLAIPFQYWNTEERWYRTLRLAEKAILLVALSLEDDFSLPYDRTPQWYGISRTTARRGITGLVGRGLLRVRHELREAPLSETGYTEERHYTLEPPFRSHRRASVKTEKA